MVPAEEDLQRFTDLAEELGLDEKEADDFITGSMKRKGYVAKRSWHDPEPDSKRETGDFFSRRQETRVSREGPRKASGGSGQYR